MSTRRSTLAAALVAAFALHCAEPAPPVPEDAVAVWKGGAIARDELERRILELPPEDRRPGDGDFAAWHGELARELAVEHILAADARAAGLEEDPEVAVALEREASDLLAEVYLQRHLPAVEQVTEKDVEALYESRRDQLVRPAQRFVRHLFLRREGDLESDEALRARLDELRREVVGGASFQLLARDHSQSETRHRDGAMGSFARGQLSPDLDRLIFGLQVKAPSEPVLTPQGGHLFWVENAVEERRFELPDVQRRFALELRRERRAEAVDGLEIDRELPPGSFLPSDEDLAVVLSSGDPRALVARFGALELHLADLLEELAEETPGDESRFARARRHVDWLQRRFFLARAAREAGLDAEPAVESRLERLRRAVLATRWAERLMLERVLGQEEELRAYYENNRRRYSEPLRLRLERLRVPIGPPGEAAGRMARLEAAKAELDAGSLELATLAEDMGGRVEAMDWMSFEGLQRLSPRAAQLTTPLAAGEVTPPFRASSSLDMLRVAERREPEVLPLSSVRRRVAEDLLAHHGPDLYQALCDELLSSRDYRPLADRLEANSASRRGAAE